MEWMGSHFLLQGIFPTQGLNPFLLHWQADSLTLNNLGSPEVTVANIFLENSVHVRGPRQSDCRHSRHSAQCQLLTREPFLVMVRLKSKGWGSA